MFTNFTEQALRAAVNTAKTDILADAEHAKTIKETALQRVEELEKGNSTAATKGAQMDLQAMAIDVAIQGLELAFAAIKGQVKELKNKRLSFDKERQAGIATFIIPTNKEEKELSKQEQVIKSFMELVAKNPTFATYLGIKSSVCSELENAEFHSVLPYYRMSDNLTQPVCSPQALDKQRTAIGLFFRSAMPDAIADIDNDFQSEVSFVEFWKSAFNKENYLNDLRAPRFIMMCLANLLWNLQHPVDPETGYPLSIERNIELCRSIGLFLNKLLNSSDKAFLKPLHNSTNNLLYFVRKVEVHVKSLQKAFIEEHLSELNITDLSNSAHNTLRIMDKSIFELIYSRKNPYTKKMQPDPRAAEELAYSVSYLNQLLADMPELINHFVPLAANAENSPFVNIPPRTVIDILILYIHSSHEDKEKLFSSLNTQNDSIAEFVCTIKNFEDKFIRPIKEVSRKELDCTAFNRKSKEVAKLTARRLVPFITLVLEDYRVQVDLPITFALDSKSEHEHTTGVKKYTASQQMVEINRMANKGDGYYAWELSPFVTLNKETEHVLDDLPKRQYRFTEITKLLDSVSEIVTNYRHFLQYKTFQAFLLKCLNKIKEEYVNLTHHIEEVDACLSKDKGINRNMQSILGLMTTDLGKSLEGFSTSFTSFEQVVSAPDFTEQQKQSLTTKLNLIHQQFTSLFSEDSGILSFVTPCTQSQDKSCPEKSNETGKGSLPPEASKSKDLSSNTTSKEIKPIGVETVLQPKQVVELRKLVNRCINALSYQSKFGEKGKLLNNLLTLIDAQGTHTQADVEKIVKELAKITLSYRPTYFFQAAYGETRSAKILIAAIKDEKFNELINISEILLGSEVEDPRYETDEEIVQRLRGIRAKNNWQESCAQMQLITTLA